MELQEDIILREFISKSGRRIKIRHFKETDLIGIWSNFNEVVYERIYLPVITPVLSDYEMESWYEAIKNRNEICLVAIDEANEAPNHVVGQITLENSRWDCAKHVYILGIIVNSKYRWEGIGKQLILASHEEAKKMKKQKIVLSCLSSNEKAIELYKSLGYTIVGIKKKQFLMGTQYVDEVLMEIFL